MFLFKQSSPRVSIPANFISIDNDCPEAVWLRTHPAAEADHEPTWVTVPELQTCHNEWSIEVIGAAGIWGMYSLIFVLCRVYCPEAVWLRTHPAAEADHEPTWVTVPELQTCHNEWSIEVTGAAGIWGMLSLIFVLCRVYSSFTPRNSFIPYLEFSETLHFLHQQVNWLGHMTSEGPHDTRTLSCTRGSSSRPSQLTHLSLASLGHRQTE